MALLLAALSCLPAPATAQDDGPLETALGLATSLPAQGTSRLDEWKALTAPAGASYPAARYAAFLRLTPPWPLQKRIAWRYERALLNAPDEDTRRVLCPAFPINRSDLLMACAPFLPDLASQARRSWRELGMTDSEQGSFLARFASVLTQDDDIQRYNRLERTGPYRAALQQAQRLPPALRPLLMARLANRFATEDADSAFQNSASSHDAALLHYRLKYLRLHDRLDEAARLWQQEPAPVLSPVLSHPAATQWQDERGTLARALLRAGQPGAAETALALLHATPAGEQTPDTQLLAGYIALTELHDPARARPYVQPLTAAADLSQRAAGFYWLARIAEYRDPAGGTALYQKAASLPTTFYGQLALARMLHAPFLTAPTRSAAFLWGLKTRLAQLPALPAGSAPLPRQDLVTAATRLQQEGDLMDATLFLTYLQARMQDDTQAQPAIARLALSLHLPKAAILAARTLSRRGVASYPAGYPLPDQPLSPTPPDGLLPALIRQESSMDSFAISPRHAYGLTQLLLPTALQTVRRHKLSYRLASPLSLLDPAINLDIGGLYLQDMLTRFGMVLPYTLAAYNAGPARSQQWQAQMQAPPAPQPEDEDRLLRWLILLPYQETRFYIDHIEADMSVYATLPAR